MALREALFRIDVAIDSSGKKIGNVILGLTGSHASKDERVFPEGVNDDHESHPALR